MSFEIEIIEGHDVSSYFWIFPVLLDKRTEIFWWDVRKIKDEISIEENDISCFLAYFFYKYFDRNLSENAERVEYDGDELEHIKGFVWNLEHNFYTYDAIKSMIEEIKDTSIALLDDDNNELLTSIIDFHSLHYETRRNSPERIQERSNTVLFLKRNLNVLIDFYDRFTTRLTQMMDRNPETNIICIEGP